MPSTRRAMLLGSIPGSALASAGCLGVLHSGTEMLDLVMYNYTSDPQPLRLELHPERPQADDDQGVVEEFTVPAPAGDASAGRLERPELLRRTQYLVRVLPKHGSGKRHHGHYHPEDAARIIIRLYAGPQPGTFTVRFR